jgi:O-antigen/teichoic acid export membrane protein
MSTTKIDTSVGRLRWNLVGIAGQFVISTGIGIWMTPYLIANLGVAVYGLVPLATNITSYLGIITVALSGSVGRFLAADLAREDREGAVRTFNTSLYASLVLSLLLLPAVAVFAYFSPAILNIPAGAESGTRWLLFAAGLAFLANTVGSNFTASTFARNRFDLQRLINALATITQAVCIVVFFSLYDASLWHVAAAIMALALVQLGGYTLLWRRLTPWLRVSYKAFARERLHEVLSMGGWLTVIRLGAMLFVKSELLVVNFVLGAQQAGLYAPLLLFSIMLQTIAELGSGALEPTFIARYVEGDRERLSANSQQAIKILGLALALPVGIIAGLGKPLLNLWLGEQYADLWPLLSLVTGHLAFNLCITPLFGIQRTLNKLQWPGIVTVVTGLLNVGLAAGLAGLTGWGLYGIGIAGAVALIVKNSLFVPLYTAHIMRCPLYTYLRWVGLILVVTVIMGAVSWGVSMVLALSSWGLLIAAGVCLATVYCGLIYCLGLNEKDRQLIKALGRR